MPYNQGCKALVTVTSHEHHGVSNEMQLNRLLNNLFRLTTNKIPKLCITGALQGESMVESPHKGPVMQKVFPCHEFIMQFQVPMGYDPNLTHTATTNYHF